MGARRKFKPKYVANALKANMGMVYITARKLGCSHQMIYNYIDQFEECRQAYEEQSGTMVDTAEVKFYEAIKNGESWAINKMLSTKGRSRGYGDQSDVNVVMSKSEADEINTQIEEALGGMLERIGRHAGSNGAAEHGVEQG